MCSLSYVYIYNIYIISFEILMGMGKQEMMKSHQAGALEKHLDEKADMGYTEQEVRLACLCAL